MPILREEYEQRWKKHFRNRLIEPQKEDPEVDKFVNDSWDAVTFEEHADGFENDPEGAADEELSYMDE